MMPLLSASPTCGTGMPTGVAPSAARNLLVMRVGARSFRPFRSPMVRTGLLVMWNTPSPCTWKASGLTSLNSARLYFCV